MISISVVILTIPAAHAAISLQNYRAWQTRLQRKALGNQARRRRKQSSGRQNRPALRVGCAPDTFLGGGLQTARKAIDDGIIGRPIAATAFFMAHGPESWHPNAGIFYLKGGGPSFRYGPLLPDRIDTPDGSVARVAGLSAHHLPGAHRH